MALTLHPYLAQASDSVSPQVGSLTEGATIAIVGLLIVFLVLIFLSLFIATLPKVLQLINAVLPESNGHHGTVHEEQDEDAELELLAAIGYVLHTEFQRQVSAGTDGKS
ncbi:MAG: OadG family protein [Rubripirellula sp.]|jgi:Na+-transporting methylmalonyl-CoA/oxaloacetate decarboxylase gamma subunit